MTDLVQIITKEHSKKQALKLLKKVLSGEDIFKAYMQIILKQSGKIQQRAYWILGDIALEQPDWILPYLNPLLDELNKKSHPAVSRNISRALQFISIPPKFQGKAYQNCFTHLQNVSNPIASRVNCLSVLSHIAQEHRDLIPELKILLKELEREDSPALIARKKMELKALSLL